MAENDWLIGLTAGLDENKSKEQIKKDIEKLRKTLDSIEFQVKLSANQQKKVKEQLDKLEIGLDNIHISESALKGLVEQVNNALSKIEIVGLNVGETDVVNQAKQLGKKINQEISQSITGNKSILENFKESLKNDNMDTSLITNVSNEIDKLNVKINSLKQSINDKGILSVDISGLDEFGQAVTLTRQFDIETGELKNSIDSISTSQKKASVDIEKSITNFTIKLENLKTKYSNIAVDYSGFDSIFNKFKSGEVSVNELSLAFNRLENSIKLGTQNLKSQDKSLDPIQQAINNMRDFPATLQNIETGINSLKDKTKLAGTSTEELRKTYENLKTEMNSVNGKVPVTDEWTQSYRTLMSTVVELTNKIEALKKAETSDKSDVKLAEQARKILLSMEGKNTKNKNYDYQINTEIKNLKNLGFTDEEVAQKVKILTQAQAELKRVIDSSNFDSVVEKNKAIVNADNERTTALNQVRTAYGQLKNDASQYYNLTKQTKLSTNIQNWLSKNTRASKDAKESLNAYYRELSSGRVSVDRLKYIESELSRLDKEQRVLGRLGKSVKDQFKQAGESFTQWLSISSAVMLVVSKSKEAVSELKEVDTLLTEISKANDKLTTSELKEIGRDSFGIASKYGKTATDYLSGVQEASRAGYENAEAMAELSVAAQGAGDMTAELANKYIIATDKAYKLGGSVEKLTEILDGSNYITNHNAVQMTELAEGMTIVGSQAASLGVEANETTAALGTMIAVTQQSGSEMARAFRAILLNIRQISDSEENIDAEGLTKYEKACNALNVALKETKNGITSLRDPMEVIKELSVEYSKLEENDIRRTNLLNSVGGKLRANALDALLMHHDMYSEMLGQYAQGTGSMAAEAEKTANSLEGSLNKLSNTFTDTVDNIVNSDGLKFIVNTLNTILSGIKGITDFLGSAGSIGVGAGIFASIKNVGRDKTYSLNC